MIPPEYLKRLEERRSHLTRDLRILEIRLAEIESLIRELRTMGGMSERVPTSGPTEVRRGKRGGPSVRGEILTILHAANEPLALKEIVRLLGERGHTFKPVAISAALHRAKVSEEITHIDGKYSINRDAPPC